MRTILLVLILFVSLYGSGEDTPQTMQRITIRMAGKDVQPGSFASKPKVNFRAGHQYCRTEEAADEDDGIHGLLVVNEPDAWMVNLANKTGKHIVDPGPTFNCRLQIFPPLEANDAPDSATNQLEFGMELDFFRSYGASPKPGPELQGHKTNVYTIEMGTTALGLLTFGTPEQPLSVSRKYQDQTEIFWYDGFEVLSFDPKLFAKPDGIVFEEVKTRSTGKKP